MQVKLFYAVRLRTAALSIITGLVAVAACPIAAEAQVVVPDRQAAEILRERKALIDEQVQELEQAFRGKIQALEGIEMPQIMMQGGFGGGMATSISVSEADGVRTTQVNENGRQYTIKQSADTIEVTYSKVYGPDDMDALKQDHPDLHMHVVSFPKESQGSAVELSIALKTTREAASAEELKEKFPEAFAIYEKYGQQRALGMRIRAGAIDFAPRLEEGIKMFEVKPAPDFFERFNRDAVEGEEKPAEEAPKPRRTIKT